MPFNFFQKKNRSDSGRTPKEGVKKITPSSDFGKEKKILKKEEIQDTSKKTNSVPEGMIPHVSEKSSDLQGINSYVFKIQKNLNKIMLKKEVEKHYGVKVDFVRIVNTKPKKRIRGNIIGKKAGYKKAVVRLKEGHKIEF